MWPDLPPAAVILVTGASGGVGVASVQLARAAGHTVIALSRDTRKAQTLRDLGAALTVDPNDPQWPRRIKEFLGRRRVDLAIDNIGGPPFNALLETLADAGRVSCVGRLAGPVPDFNTASLFFRRLRIGGVSVGAYTAPESRAAWGQIVTSLARANATPLIDSIHPFSDLQKAFARLKSGPMGKVLLRIA
jgi:NADPH2:quinone reductase